MVKYKRKKRKYRNSHFENTFDKYGNNTYSYLTLPDLGKCAIVVMVNEESDIPHFHIISKKKGVNISLNIFNAEYNHIVEYRLNRKQLEIIQEFINKDDLVNKGFGLNIQSALYYRWECVGNIERDDLEFSVNDENYSIDYTDLAKGGKYGKI